MGALAREADASPPPPYRPSGSTSSRLAFWVMNQAPFADPIDRAIVQEFARTGDPDGCNCFPSLDTVAARVGVTKRTVQRRLPGILARGMMRVQPGPKPPGWYALDVNNRPKVYEILAPASVWKGTRLEEINRYRADRGRPAITAENRPEVAPPPPRKPRSDKGKPCPQRGRKAARAVAAEPLAPPPAEAPPEVLEAPPVEASPEPVECVAEAPPVGVLEAPRGDSETPAGGDSESPNLSLAQDLYLSRACAPAVGDQGQVVGAPASSAKAGKIKSKRRRRPLFVVSAEAVEVYRAAIPASVKRYIPEHAVGRVLRAITVELERQADRLGCDDPAELGRVMAERAEPWLFRMVDARDPVAVVIGLIVRGAQGAPDVLPWCGLCDGATPARRFRHAADGRPYRCPDCHPAVAPLEAGGPPHDAQGGPS